MAQSEEHYRAAAHSLGEGFLGSKFGQSNLDQAEVSKIHRVEAFKENAILLAGDNATQMGVMDRGAQAGKSNIEAQQKRAKDAKRSADNILFLNLLEQHSARLDREIADLEAGFEAKHGDAWRETTANEILDPDEIPERRDGESMADYRERLEDVLIEKMIDPATGEIKPEYDGHPEFGRYAEWAQSRYEKEAIDAYVADVTDPDATPAEIEARTERFKSEHSFEDIMKAERVVDGQAVAAPMLNTEIDDQVDEVADASTEMAAFGLG